MTALHNPTRELAEFIAGFDANSLPESTRHAARRVLLDAVGVMAAASGVSDEVQPFIAYAREMGKGGFCTILGSGQTATAPLAALANGAMAHALDFEDVYDAVPCHPNASTVPAAIAIAQHTRDASADELLSAITLGCETVCRVGLSLGQPIEDSGWYSPTVLGSLGAAVAVAKLLRFGPRQIADVLSLQFMQYAAPGEIMHDPTTTARATREAYPAHAAVSAGLLTKYGTSGFADPLGGKGGFFRLFANAHYEPEELLGSLGKKFLIEEVSFKRWPSCRGTHGAIEATLELCRSNDFGYHDIESVEVGISELQRMLIEPRVRKQMPLTAIDAKFSLPFTVASTLVHGKLTLDEFSTAAIADTNVLEISRKIQFAIRENWGRDKAAAGSVAICLVDGRRFDATVMMPTGSTALPASDEVLQDKFVECYGRAAQPLTASKAGRVAQSILKLRGPTSVTETLAIL